MTTKRVFCESSGHSVAHYAAPLLGMSCLYGVCCSEDKFLHFICLNF